MSNDKDHRYVKGYKTNAKAHQSTLEMLSYLLYIEEGERSLLEHSIGFETNAYTIEIC